MMLAHPGPTVVEALCRRAADSPEAVAYTADGDAVYCRALLGDALRVMGALAARGMGPGTRCAVALPTSLDFVRVVYGALLAGVAPVILPPGLPPVVVRGRLALTRCALAVTAPVAVAAVSAGAPCPVVTPRELATGPCGGPLPCDVEPGRTAFLQLTSGTTGEPRAVVITHANVMASLAGSAERLGFSPADVFATWVPLHHDLGLVRYVFGAMAAGCASHLVTPSLLSLSGWLETIHRTRATVTGGPDSGYRLATRTVDPARVNLSSLRYAGNGGEPARRSTIDAFERRFGIRDVVRPAYGLAEATLAVTSMAPGEPLRVDAAGVVTCGRAVQGLEVAIARRGGGHAGPGEQGEIVVRGPSVFGGYFENEVATREALRDGWLYTGDIGSLDAGGHLFVTGRHRALIKRGGGTIIPRDIEEAAERGTGVLCAAAFGVPSMSAGTEDVVVVAEAERHAGAPADVVRGIAERVSEVAGGRPSRVLLVERDVIPRTALGKIQYDALRGLLASGELARACLAEA